MLLKVNRFCAEQVKQEKGKTANSSEKKKKDFPHPPSPLVHAVQRIYVVLFFNPSEKIKETQSLQHTKTYIPPST